jgi:hypothetical protein
VIERREQFVARPVYLCSLVSLFRAMNLSHRAHHSIEYGSRNIDVQILSDLSACFIRVHVDKCVCAVVICMFI